MKGGKKRRRPLTVVQKEDQDDQEGERDARRRVHPAQHRGCRRETQAGETEAATHDAARKGSLLPLFSVLIVAAVMIPLQ